MLLSKTTIGQHCLDSWATHIKTIPSGGLGNDQPEIIALADGSSICVAVLVVADSLSIGAETVDVPNPTTATPTIVVIKLSPNGVYAWHTLISCNGPSSLTDAAVSDDGSIFVSGTQRSGLEVQGTSIPGVASQSRYFIVKFDASGSYQWYRSADFGASTCAALDCDDSKLEFAVAFSDSVQIGSQVFQAGPQTLPSSFDVVVGELDTDGDLISQTVLSGAGSIAVNEMAKTSSGIVIQGRFEQELIVDGQQFTTPQSGHYSFFQLHLNSSYGLEWVNMSENPVSLFSSLNGLSSDSAFVYSSGFYDGGFTLNGNVFTTSASRAVLIFKTSVQDGSIQWVKNFDGNSYDVSEASLNFQGNVIVGGHFGSTSLNLDGEVLTNANAETSDSFIASYDKDSSLRCYQSISGNGDQSVRSIQRLSDGYILALINFNESITLDDMVYTPNGNDILVWKTCLPCDTLTSVKETNLAQEAAFEIHPNPTATQTKLTYHTPQGAHPTLHVADMLGRVVQTVQLPTNEGTYTLDASTLGTGVYFCTLLSGAEVLATQKLSVIKNE
jgi:hypothetical protein